MNLSSKNNLKMSPKETDSRTEVKMHSRKKEILHREFDSTKCANIIILDSWENLEEIVGYIFIRWSNLNSSIPRNSVAGKM